MNGSQLDYFDLRLKKNKRTYNSILMSFGKVTTQLLFFLANVSFVGTWPISLSVLGPYILVFYMFRPYGYFF